jgi:hypothetical protein
MSWGVKKFMEDILSLTTLKTSKSMMSHHLYSTPEKSMLGMIPSFLRERFWILKILFLVPMSAVIRGGRLRMAQSLAQIAF